MTEPFMCPKCGHEIQPGDPVSIITDESMEDIRIVYDSDVIIVHEECPVDDPIRV